MTTTLEKAGKRRGVRKPGASSEPHEAGPGAVERHVAAAGPPPKLRRRPLLVAASVAAVALGAAGGAWVFTSMSDEVSVIGVRAAVARGEVIGADDLMVVRMSPDPGLRPVTADRAEEVVGVRSAVDLQPGGLLTEAALVEPVTPAEGQSVVGVALPPTLMPAEQLLVGDRVRIVETPGQGAASDPGEGTVAPWSIEATVAGISAADVVAGGTSVVDVIVPHDQAADLAARAATGNVILVLDSRDRD